MEHWRRGQKVKLVNITVNNTYQHHILTSMLGAEFITSGILFVNTSNTSMYPGENIRHTQIMEHSTKHLTSTL